MNEDYDKLLEMWRDEKKRRQFSEQELSKEVKLRQEAEGELTIIKGIGNNSPEMKLLQKEVEALKTQLHTDRSNSQKELDRVKKENNDCYNRIAKLQDIVHQKTARILSLEQIEEQHHKLNRETMKENKQLRNDNKQLAKQVTDQIDRLRRGGL